MANIIDSNIIGCIKGISHSNSRSNLVVALVKLRYDNGDIRWRCRIGNKGKDYFYCFCYVYFIVAIDYIVALA